MAFLMQKMRDTFEQRVSDINHGKHAENHEEDAMVFIVMGFVID